MKKSKYSTAEHYSPSCITPDNLTSIVGIQQGYHIYNLLGDFMGFNILNNILKSMKTSTAERVLALAPFRILLKIRVWLEIDRPSLKPFWLSRSFPPISGWIHLSIILLRVFVTTDVSLILERYY